MVVYICYRIPGITISAHLYFYILTWSRQLWYFLLGPSRKILNPQVLTWTKSVPARVFLLLGQSTSATDALPRPILKQEWAASRKISSLLTYFIHPAICLSIINTSPAYQTIAVPSRKRSVMYTYSLTCHKMPARSSSLSKGNKRGSIGNKKTRQQKQLKNLSPTKRNVRHLAGRSLTWPASPPIKSAAGIEQMERRKDEQIPTATYLWRGHSVWVLGGGLFLPIRVPMKLSGWKWTFENWVRQMWLLVEKLERIGIDG